MEESNEFNNNVFGMRSEREASYTSKGQGGRERPESQERNGSGLCEQEAPCFLPIYISQHPPANPSGDSQATRRPLASLSTDSSADGVLL